MSDYSPAPQRHRSPWPMISFAAFVVLVVAACVTVLLIHNQSTASSTAAQASVVAHAPAASADQQLVTQLNVIKGKYPQDTTARVTLDNLPTFVHIACSVISSGLGSTPEWKDVAALLAQTHRCAGAVPTT